MASIAANGGMASSNNYDLSFDFSGEKKNTLRGIFDDMGLDPTTARNDDGTPGSLINLFCDEVNLPSVSAATGQIVNRYQGEGNVNYAHTRMDTDLSLSWMCDANMAPYKFVATWLDFIFGEKTEIKSASTLKDFKGQAVAKDISRVSRLKYPEEYTCTVKIAKAEKGKNAPNSRVPLTVVYENVYPYSLDAVPLSYGTSQLVKVSASFYYTRYVNYFADIRKYDG